MRSNSQKGATRRLARSLRLSIWQFPDPSALCAIIALDDA